MKKQLLLVALLMLGVVIFPSLAAARMGVGVGTGKIQVDDKLKPGTIYELPPLTVLNTGDEPSDYEVAISYMEKQDQKKPGKEWFIFTPQNFHLEPGKVQVVNIKLNLPVKMEPGEYFAYLEGHPTKKVESGSASIGIAAAAKLYFTVVPANFLTGVFYKISSFWKVYAPWPQRVASVVGLLVAALIIRKYLNIEVGIRKPKNG